MKKRVLSVLLAVCMISFFSVPFFAAEKVDLTIQPADTEIGEICVGYTDPVGAQITVLNSGGGQVTLDEPKSSNNSMYFDLGRLSKTVLEPGESATFEVSPKIGLGAGNYSQTLYVQTGAHKFSFNVSITIIKHNAEYYEAKDPTCTENGFVAYWYCKHCGKRFFDEECTKGISAKDVVIDPIGHVWNDYYTVDVEPTCTKVGETSIHCAFCDARTSVTELPMTNHIYGDWVITEEPTCTEEGTMVKTCTKCDAVKKATVSATGHDWQPEDGSSEQVECSQCGEVKNKSDYVECDHEFGEWSVLIEPTCSEEGYKERVCKLCGHFESDTVATLEHNWEDSFTVDREADCENDGLKSIHCKDCDAVKDETVIPKLEHDFGEWTENEEGTEKTRTCSRCGTVETEKTENEIAVAESTNITEGENSEENSINQLLASFTTVITNTEEARHNMSVAASSCNDTVIMPGETWSFNGCTGNSNLPENGYLPATVIANGQYTQGYGGGICQVSSTIYNAALGANLEIVERNYHYWASDYVKAGFDATINYGDLDLKLKNNTEYPVYLKCYTDGNTVTACFYGWKDPSFDDIATYSYNYEIDPGYYGTESYRVYLKDGAELYREKLPGSKYKLDEAHGVWTPDSGTICADEDAPERYIEIAKEPEDIGYGQ